MTTNVSIKEIAVRLDLTLLASAIVGLNREQLSSGRA
jgi:hypothetical protein